MKNITRKTILIITAATVVSNYTFAQSPPENIRVFETLTNQKSCEVFHNHIMIDVSKVPNFSQLSRKEQDELKSLNGSEFGSLGVTTGPRNYSGVFWICAPDNKLKIMGPISEGALSLSKQDIAAANLLLLTEGQCYSKIEIKDILVKREGHCKNMSVDMSVIENGEPFIYRASGQGRLEKIR